MGYIYDGKLGVTHRCKVYLQFLVSKRLPFMFEDWFQESYFNTDIYNSHTSVNKDLTVLFFVNLFQTVKMWATECWYNSQAHTYPFPWVELKTFLVPMWYHDGSIVFGMCLCEFMMIYYICLRICFHIIEQYVKWKNLLYVYIH